MARDRETERELRGRKGNVCMCYLGEFSASDTFHRLSFNYSDALS